MIDFWEHCIAEYHEFSRTTSRGLPWHWDRRERQSNLQSFLNLCTFAFQAAACAGCPNQAICASAGPAAPDPDVDLIARNLDAVKNIVLVLSGKVKPLFLCLTKSAMFDCREALERVQ